jgi:hypothetical protein
MFPQHSDRGIAEVAKVSQPFVGEIRRQLITIISCNSRMGRDGRRRKAPNRRISDESDYFVRIDRQLEAVVSDDSEVSTDQIRQNVVKALTEATAALINAYEWLDIKPSVANDLEIFEALNKVHTANKSFRPLLRAERAISASAPPVTEVLCSKRSLQSLVNEVVLGMSSKEQLTNPGRD